MPTAHHIVAVGDTLSAIARLYGSSVEAIRLANRRIGDVNLIYPGEVIHVPVSQPPPPPPPPVDPPPDTGDDFMGLNARVYGLAETNTPAQNTAALKACVTDACLLRRQVLIPAGTYRVADGCLTPPLGINAQGLTVVGEGQHNTVLEMERGNGPSYFFDNSDNGVGNGLTLRRAKFIDIGFTGGPTDTSAQRVDVNRDCYGFRLFGASDQNFRFTRCRFQTMAGVWESWGHNNASEIGFSDCFIAHVSDHVVKSDNLQALNYFFWNCDVEIVWGDMFRFVDSVYGAKGGGGSVGVFGGSWIIQSHDGRNGAVVRVLDGVPVTSVLNFFGTRFEVRNQATVVDGSQGGLLTVNFDGCNLTTIEKAGQIRTVDITDNQFVGFTRCTFEHNGSHAGYNVQGDAWLVFDQCAVRTSLASEITAGSRATVKAINCRGRFAQSTPIDFEL